MTHKNLIQSSGSILVNKNVASVFDFFANPTKDPLWRTEINASKLQGKLEVGATILEYSNLSKKAPNHLIELSCIQYEQNQLAVFETADQAQFYLKSRRQVKSMAPNKTEIIYTLFFDKALVKFALGFSLPTFIISLKADRDLKKYLRQLKTSLENP